MNARTHTSIHSNMHTHTHAHKHPSAERCKMKGSLAGLKFNLFSIKKLWVWGARNKASVAISLSSMTQNFDILAISSITYNQNAFKKHLNLIAAACYLPWKERRVILKNAMINLLKKPTIMLYKAVVRERGEGRSVQRRVIVYLCTYLAWGLDKSGRYI